MIATLKVSLHEIWGLVSNLKNFPGLPESPSTPSSLALSYLKLQMYVWGSGNNMGLCEHLAQGRKVHCDRRSFHLCFLCIGCRKNSAQQWHFMIYCKSCYRKALRPKDMVTWGAYMHNADNGERLGIKLEVVQSHNQSRHF